MNDDFDNARTDREMLARYAVLADPDRIRTNSPGRAQGPRRPAG